MKRSRRTDAMSLIEMVVTIAIISIVSMGLMSLLWVDSWWLFKLSNKTDNIIAAQQFLDRFSTEVRAAENVVTGSNAQNLVVNVPIFESDRIGNSLYLGFPLQSFDTLTYTVQRAAVQDLTAPTQYEIVRSVKVGSPQMPYHPEDGRTTITSATVLTGLIGPTDGNGAPKIFEYTTHGVIANIEMLRFLPGNRSSDPLTLRTQVYMHNFNMDILN